MTILAFQLATKTKNAGCRHRGVSREEGPLLVCHFAAQMSSYFFGEAEGTNTARIGNVATVRRVIRLPGFRGDGLADVFWSPPPVVFCHRAVQVHTDPPVEVAHLAHSSLPHLRHLRT